MQPLLQLQLLNIMLNRQQIADTALNKNGEQQSRIATNYLFLLFFKIKYEHKFIQTQGNFKRKYLKDMPWWD